MRKCEHIICTQETSAVKMYSSFGSKTMFLLSTEQILAFLDPQILRYRLTESFEI